MMLNSYEDNIIAESPEMQRVLKTALKFAHLGVSNILITGASGTGKGVLARYIHQNSHSESKPFIQINCAALPDKLLEAELFGYEPGAFTGANPQGKPGLFEMARDGTLFLDEIGELPYGGQAKFLKCLEDYQIMRLGGLRPIKINCAILAATNKDLKALSMEKQFRKDLYYRLNAFKIFIPPLKDRPDDIFKLTHHFLDTYNERYHAGKRLSLKEMEMLQKHPFPGNIRELKNFIKKAVVMCPGDSLQEIIQEELSDSREKAMDSHVKLDDWMSVSLKEKLDEVEKKIFEMARQQLGSTRRIADQLGISQSGAARKLQKYQIK